MNAFKRKLAVKNLFSYPIVLVYLTVLFYIPNEIFRDRENYVLYAYDSRNFFQYEKTDIAYYANEPLFLYLADLFNTIPEMFPTFMGVFIAFIYCAYTIKFSKNTLLFIMGFILLISNTFLIYPQIMVLRQGLATALFLVVFFSVNNIKLRLVLSLLIPFIHVVFIFIIPLYFIFYFILSRKSKFIVFLYTAIFTLTISIVFFIVASALGLRQAEQYEGVAQASLGGGSFVLHTIVLIYLYFLGNTENNHLYKWSLIGLTFYVFSYFLIPSAGRFFISFYPFVLYSLISRARLRDFLLIGLLCLMFGILFFNGGLSGMLAE